MKVERWAYSPAPEPFLSDRRLSAARKSALVPNDAGISGQPKKMAPFGAIFLASINNDDRVRA